MSAEYVRISQSEQVFGETNLLQTQLSLLTTLKHWQEYMLLKHDELLMKLEVKKKVEEAKAFLDSMSKCLPESKLLEEQEKEERVRKQIIDKIESAVQKSGKSEWKHWIETEPKPRKVREIKEKPAKPVAKEVEEPQSALDKELASIQKKLARLQ